jgi:hypothetical protein
VRTARRRTWQLALTAKPDERAALLRKALKPAPSADAKEVERLVRLDGDDFGAREKASPI